MKFLTWILILCFASQAMAATVREGLEAAINDYEYSMVVDWDQKDSKVAEAFTQKFTDKIEALYQQGMTNDILMKYVESRVFDKKKLAAIQAAAALTAEGGSSAQNIAKAIQENKLGVQGASWSGGIAAAGIITGIVAIAALIVYQLVWELNHRCESGYTTEVCGHESFCTDYDYDFEDGSEYCSNSETQYVCNDVEKCSNWVKY